MTSVRKAVMTSVALMVLRRRLQRQSGPTAAVALLGLELLGPRILHLRRLLLWALALTVVGVVVVAGLWWWRRGSGRPASEPAPVSVVTPPAPPPFPDAA